MIMLLDFGLDPYRDEQSAPAKGICIMDKNEGRTTFKFGECVISYERNISSLILVDMPIPEHSRAAASPGIPAKASRAAGTPKRLPRPGR